MSILIIRHIHCCYIFSTVDISSNNGRFVPKVVAKINIEDIHTLLHLTVTYNQKIV